MKKKNIFKFLSEGILIILSVLIAFFIDEYRDSRNEKQSCISYLKSMRQDLVADTLYLGHRIKDFKEILINSDLLLNVAEYDDPLPKWFKEENNSNFEEALYGVLLPINFQNNPSYESMKANGDLKLINDLALQVELNRHYSKCKFADVAMNEELKRITQSRKDFVNHSGLFGLKNPNSINEALAKRILKSVELHSIIYDSRQVLVTVLKRMGDTKENAAGLINKIDEYITVQ